MNVATVIIGIDGWEQYTLPLLRSIDKQGIRRNAIIDNASETPYPNFPNVHRTERLCYAAAINRGVEWVADADWYVILSNDVLCTGPFAHLLEASRDDRIVGPHMAHNQGYEYLEGWCVAIPRKVWDAIGGWDEAFRISSYEDVDYSYMAMEHGFDVVCDPAFPFVHLDQKQRFTLVPDYWSSEAHNLAYFREKRERVQLTPGWRRLPQAVTA